MSRLAFAFAIVIGIASTAVADLPPPPPPKGFKQVPLQHELRLAVEIADYQFFTFERLGIGGKENVSEPLKLSVETGVPVPSSQSASVRTGVVAVPAALVKELKTPANIAALLYRENADKLPAGVVVHETNGTVQDIPKKDPRTKVVKVITVSRDDKAGVRFSEAATPAPADTKSSAAETSSSALALHKPWRTLAAGVFLAAAFASIGLRFLRRRAAR
ncbi:MAG: hypothetical protein U0939_01775 [Pirellulales bacterium]